MSDEHKNPAPSDLTAPASGELRVTGFRGDPSRIVLSNGHEATITQKLIDAFATAAPSNHEPIGYVSTQTLSELLHDNSGEYKITATHDVMSDDMIAIYASPDAHPGTPAPSDHVVPPEWCGLTFAVQHNPNCPSPWLVRLPGKGPIDMLPYGDPLRLVKHQTGDILGFGKTLEEAARAALTASEGSTE
jgi:hypothetical protein